MSHRLPSKPQVLPELSLDGWFGLPEDQPGELVDGRLEGLTLDLDSLWAAIDSLE